jgi:tRNA modification GTPase
VNDTIFALATAHGPAAVAIVRISGPACEKAVSALVRNPVPFDRVAHLRALHDPADGALLDEALILGFPAGRSYTGAVSAELHLHGGPATVRRVLLALAEVDGLRPAGPGEFTRQALENGRLDLTQAEGVADLVAAETDGQRALALDGLRGAVSDQVTLWREQILHAMALLEAAIDFPDEGDVTDAALDPVAALVEALRADIAAEIGRSDAARRIREGFVVAIVGAPNAGKSTLINAVARRDVAITSDIPGTTRDVIEARCDLGGQAVTFLDTAGLRDTTDTIEALGVSRTRERADAADMRLFLVAPDAPAPEATWRDGDVWVRNKIDASTGVGISALTGDGIDWLLSLVAARVASEAGNRGAAFRERHVVGLKRAADALAVDVSAEPEILADALRQAVMALDAIVGGVDVEDVLDLVFSRFCIGK